MLSANINPLVVRVISENKADRRRFISDVLQKTNVVRIFYAKHKIAVQDTLKIEVTHSDITVNVHFFGVKTNDYPDWSHAHMELYLVNNADFIKTIKAYCPNNKTPRIIAINTPCEDAVSDGKPNFLSEINKVIKNMSSATVFFVNYRERNSILELLATIADEALRVNARQKAKSATSYRSLLKKLRHKAPPLLSFIPDVRISQRKQNADHNLKTPIYTLPPELLTTIAEMTTEENPNLLKNLLPVSQRFNQELSWINESRKDKLQFIRVSLCQLTSDTTYFSPQKQEKLRNAIINAKLNSHLKNSPLPVKTTTVKPSMPHWYDMDLSYLDLNSLVADGIMIQNVTFKSADLSFCEFTKTTFINCCFDEANLSMANLNRCVFIGACSFRNANFKHTNVYQINLGLLFPYPLEIARQERVRAGICAIIEHVRIGSSLDDALAELIGVLENLQIRNAREIRFNTDHNRVLSSRL